MRVVEWKNTWEEVCGGVILYETIDQSLEKAMAACLLIAETETPLRMLLRDFYIRPHYLSQVTSVFLVHDLTFRHRVYYLEEYIQSSKPYAAG